MKTRSKKVKKVPVQPQTDHEENLLNHQYPISFLVSQQQAQQSNSKLSETLSTGYQPKDITCRQMEKSQISKFVKNCLSNYGQNNARVLCTYEKIIDVSGVPGVGKTLSVMRVIKQLRKNIHYKKAIFKYINAMQLKVPQRIYYAINTELFKVQKNDLGRKNISIMLQSKLIADSRIKFLVIDQIDFLYTKNQEILYTLFQWCNIPETRLCTIIIANTMDFPQKLAEKITSRMGQARLVFKPYSLQEVQVILQERLAKSNRFTKDAIQYACKKMSTYTSDVRKLLNVLRGCLQSQKKRIGIDDVVREWRTISQEKGEEWQESMPEYYRKILQVIKSFGGKDNLTRIHEVIKSKYNSRKGEVIETCKIMAEMGILKMYEKKIDGRIDYQVILLKI